MTKKQFAEVMAYLEAATDKPLSADRAAIYFDLLNDLPVDVLRTAAKRVLLQPQWGRFPDVLELRQAAADTIQAQVAEMTPERAWGLAWAAAGKLSFDCPPGQYWANGKRWPSQVAYVMSTVPPLVARAMSNFGLAALAHGREPIGVVRGQFLKCFQQIIEERKRLALMPPALVREIEQQNQKALPAPVAKVIGQIGMEEP